MLWITLPARRLLSVLDVDLALETDSTDVASPALPVDPHRGAGRVASRGQQVCHQALPAFSAWGNDKWVAMLTYMYRNLVATRFLTRD